MVRFRHFTLSMMTVVAFLLLSLGFAQISVPAYPKTPPSVSALVRGDILAGDGAPLALTRQGDRLYPQGRLAAPLLGFVGLDGGLEGLEMAFDEELATGQSLQLTLELPLQASTDALLAAAVKRHQAEFGSLIVMEVRTGHLLAVSSAPGFDPQHWQAAPPEHWRNRAFLDEYEPGSVGKALTIGYLLDQGKADRHTVYPAPMSLPVEQHVIGDITAHPEEMDLEGILRFSSNTGMTHLVRDVSSESFHGALRAYGLGVAPGTGLPEANGTLRPPDRWGKIGHANHSFGQGYTLSTLQLSAAFNVLAGDGLYRAPVLVRRDKEPLPVPVLQRQSAQLTRTLMARATLASHAEQPLYREYRLAGKTGTAQLVENGRYSPDKFISSYAGFAPADAPQITVALMLYGARQGHHGSESGAPLFAEVMSSYFSLKGIPPS